MAATAAKGVLLFSVLMNKRAAVVEAYSHLLAAVDADQRQRATAFRAAHAALQLSYAGEWMGLAPEALPHWAKVVNLHELEQAQAFFYLECHRKQPTCSLYVSLYLKLQENGYALWVRQSDQREERREEDYGYVFDTKEMMNLIGERTDKLLLRTHG